MFDTVNAIKCGNNLNKINLIVLCHMSNSLVPILIYGCYVVTVLDMIKYSSFEVGLSDIDNIKANLFPQFFRFLF